MRESRVDSGVQGAMASRFSVRVDVLVDARFGCDVDAALPVT